MDLFDVGRYWRCIEVPKRETQARGESKASDLKARLDSRDPRPSPLAWHSDGRRFGKEQLDVQRAHELHLLYICNSESKAPSRPEKKKSTQKPNVYPLKASAQMCKDGWLSRTACICTTSVPTQSKN